METRIWFLWTEGMATFALDFPQNAICQWNFINKMVKGFFTSQSGRNEKICLKI